MIILVPKTDVLKPEPPPVNHEALRFLRISVGADCITDKALLVGTIGGVAQVRANKTESSVCIPPAFIITDSDGAAWSLSEEEYAPLPIHNGRFQFLVMRNDINIDNAYASVIEYRNGQVRIYGDYGVKTLSRDRRHFI